jgi:hypothetical protein
MGTTGEIVLYAPDEFKRLKLIGTSNEFMHGMDRELGLRIGKRASAQLKLTLRHPGKYDISFVNHLGIGPT